MPVTHLSPGAPNDEVCDVLERDGCVGPGAVPQPIHRDQWGSHKFENRLSFAQDDTEPALMEAGSVLLYTGSLYHGAGPNRSDSIRAGLIVHYCLGWLRQEENQYLSVPPDVLKTLPEDLLRLMGYAFGAYSLGFIDGGRDPIAAIRPDLEERKMKYEAVDRVAK